MLFENRTINIFDEQEDYLPQTMRTDIQEREGAYLLEIELPGFSKEEVQAELKDGLLTIVANHSDILEKQETKVHYIHKERILTGCKRSFYVGSRVKQEDITAAFKDGILNIIINNPEKTVERDEIRLIPIN